MPKTKSTDAFLPSEIKVLVQLSISGTYQLTAEALFLSKETVSTELRNARLRNHLKGNVPLYKRAVELGFITIVLKNS